MARLKEIFAKNLKANRNKYGLSQAKLAEKADISTHYVAMLELAHNFPTADILERLAAAMGIQVFELFFVSPSPREEVERLHLAVIEDIRNTIDTEIEKALEKHLTRLWANKENPNENAHNSGKRRQQINPRRKK